MTGLRTISWGVGVQSTALVVLAARGDIDFPVALFANVGDDSEHPATIAYFHDHARPWAESHGIEVHELHRTKRDGTTETLMGRLMKEGSKSLPIPVRMSNGAPGTRSCTSDFKIRVVGRWLKAHGATPDNPATTAIGFSTDEFQRAHNRNPIPYETPTYPLLDLGLNRADCAKIVVDAGLPPAPKSACYFCPYHDRRAWAEMRRDRPDLFEASAKLEDTLNERRDMLGKDHVYLSRYGKPLRAAIGEAQPTLTVFDPDEGPETCDDGGCWT